ncbi:MAG: ABC transporter permease [Rhodothermales bacterium]
MRRYFFELTESFLIAVRAVVSNKMRAVLTTLGIIIGIVSVTGMATIVNGIEQGFENDMASLGADVMYVERWPWVGGPGFKWWEYINRPRIDVDIATAINERASLVEAATAVVTTGRAAVSEHQNLPNITVRGTLANYPMVQTVDLQEGYFYSEVDDLSARSVAVVGAVVASELFPVGNALGKTIRIGGHRYRIIGILKKEGQGGGGNDTSAFVPFSSFQKHFGTRWRDASVRAKIVSGVPVAEARDELRGVVRLARGLQAGEEDDFEINEQESLRAAIAPIKNAIFGIGIGLTALALLVGGIGVMNIMFVTVKERTREIGIRKAVGARRRTILMQFLIEAIVICMVGGVVGVLLSIPLALLISLVLPAQMGVGIVAIAFGICVAIGTTFGLAPAWSAANATPIEALRYE